MLILVLGFIVPISAHAQEETAEGKALQSRGVVAGFASSHLENESEDYDVVPLMLRFSYNPNDALNKVGIDLPGDWQFNVEPFYGQTLSPGNSPEVGCGFMLRFNLPVIKDRMAWFVEGGVGPIYLGEDTEEQGGHFNFIDQAGGGLSLKLNKRLSAEVAYRFRHVSNAGLDSPNSGINGNTYLLALNWRY
ncbi:MAG: acyloxyacyl hydrolase [Lentisphaeria bacterium]